MKKLSNLNGAQKLNKEEQKSISGGAQSLAGCDKFYLSDADGIHCIKSGGAAGIIKYIGGRDYCCNI